MPNQQLVKPDDPVSPAEQPTSTRNNAGKIISQDQAAVHVGNVYNYGSRSQPCAARPPPCRVIPFPRNEDVIDRLDLLLDLERLFLPGPDYQSAALWGLGGSGSKTQIALQYAYRRSNDVACSVFWVHADNEAAFAQDYKLIAKKLGLPNALDDEELLTAVRARIESDPCWVLVLDNADNLGLFGVGQTGSLVQRRGQRPSLDRFVPRGPGGTVLWTSRDKRIAGSLVGARRAIEVACMTADEAKMLLETARNEKIGDEEEEDAMVLLNELGRLPLAISQAGTYMLRTSKPIEKYLSELKNCTKRWEVLQTSEFDRHRRPHVSNSVLETWNISIELIRQADKTAYNILHTLAFLDNQNIPFEMIAQAAIFSGKPRTPIERLRRLTAFCTKPRDRACGNKDGDANAIQAITLLRQFSFLSQRVSKAESQAYEMHKLVQEAARYNLSTRGGQKEDMAFFSRAALQAMGHLLFKPSLSCRAYGRNTLNMHIKCVSGQKYVKGRRRPQGF